MKLLDLLYYMTEICKVFKTKFGIAEASEHQLIEGEIVTTFERKNIYEDDKCIWNVGHKNLLGYIIGLIMLLLLGLYKVKVGYKIKDIGSLYVISFSEICSFLKEKLLNQLLVTF
jgi:hypothetical protein